MTDQFNTHPQPRTFAPSKEDVLQNLQYFFGAPVSPEKLKDYSEHHAVTHHFPGLQFDTQTIAMYRCARLQCDSPHRPCACADAYVGQNTKIRDTLNNLILNVCSPHHTRQIVAPRTANVRLLTPLRLCVAQSPQTWQTSVGLPYFQIQGTVVEWDEVRFDVRLMRTRSRYSNHQFPPHARLRN